jgi:hypothetical protein
MQIRIKSNLLELRYLGAASAQYAGAPNSTNPWLDGALGDWLEMI